MIGATSVSEYCFCLVLFISAHPVGKAAVGWLQSCTDLVSWDYVKRRRNELYANCYPRERTACSLEKNKTNYFCCKIPWFLESERVLMLVYQTLRLRESRQKNNIICLYPLTSNLMWFLVFYSPKHCISTDGSVLKSIFQCRFMFILFYFLFMWTFQLRGKQHQMKSTCCG